MSQPNLNVAEVVVSLGGHPRSDDSENVQLLANEVVILREKLKDAEDAEGRCERHLGRESEARKIAERRAGIAEGVMAVVERAVSDGKRDAVAAGAPLHLKDEVGHGRGSAGTPLHAAV